MQNQPKELKDEDELRNVLTHSGLWAALRYNSVLSRVGPHVVRDLVSEIEMVTLLSGDTLFLECEKEDSLYVVLSGRLHLWTEASTRRNALSAAGPGDLVGEAALVEDRPYGVTATAVRDTNLGRLSRAAFHRFVRKHPEAAAQWLASSSLSHLDSPRARRSAASVAVVPLRDDAQVDPFCARLTTALSALGSAIHLSRVKVDGESRRAGFAQSSAPDTGASELAGWLAEVESRHDFVVYQCDAALSPWTQRVLRQTDHVLVLGRAAGDPSPGEAEAGIPVGDDADDGYGRSFVLLHEDDRDPEGTAAWLRLRDVSAHHHVRLHSPSDFDRLARFVTGKAFALTLGGGYARGLAHIGVLRALDELGIAVDAIGGASMGALLASQWVQGWDYDTMVDKTRRACSDSMRDFTLPVVALKRGRRFSRWIREFCGDRQIEDLRVPFFCLSANLNRSEARVHTRGSLAKAILASTRTPVLFPPVIYDGELHVDGGIFNNVPIDVMTRFANGGTVVGVDVSPPHELSRSVDYGDELSWWRAFWERYRPVTNGVRIPSVLAIFLRTAEFGGVSYKKHKTELADLYLRPPLLRYKRTDFHAAEEIIDIGYRCAMSELEAWLERAGSANEPPGRL